MLHRRCFFLFYFGGETRSLRTGCALSGSLQSIGIGAGCNESGRFGSQADGFGTSCLAQGIALKATASWKAALDKGFQPFRLAIGQCVAAHSGSASACSTSPVLRFCTKATAPDLPRLRPMSATAIFASARPPAPSATGAPHSRAT